MARVRSIARRPGHGSRTAGRELAGRAPNLPMTIAWHGISWPRAVGRRPSFERICSQRRYPGPRATGFSARDPMSSLFNADFVTIVSGLPRSGTSMMMRMLEAGGIPVVVDHDRKPDADNPN